MTYYIYRHKTKNLAICCSEEYGDYVNNLEFDTPALYGERLTDNAIEYYYSKDDSYYKISEFKEIKVTI